MLEIIKTCNVWNLEEELWSGAIDTLNVIIGNNKVSELMQLLEDIFYEPTDITTVNDFLWFDSDYIFEQLKIEEE